MECGIMAYRINKINQPFFASHISHRCNTLCKHLHKMHYHLVLSNMLLSIQVDDAPSVQFFPGIVRVSSCKCVYHVCRNKTKNPLFSMEFAVRLSLLAASTYLFCSPGLIAWQIFSTAGLLNAQPTLCQDISLLNLELQDTHLATPDQTDEFDEFDLLAGV